MQTTNTNPDGARDLTTAGAATFSGIGRKSQSEFARSWRRFVRYKPGLIGLGFVALLGLVAVLAEQIAPYSPTASLASRGENLSLTHLLGADEIGRDLLSRMIFGTRVALIVALTATFISAVVGVTVGAVAGFFGGWVDTILSRIVDALMAFPLMVLLIGLVSVFGPSLTTIVLVIGATVWAPYARIVRADVLSAREREYVLAARTIGARSPRLIFRHIVPNILAPVIVLATLSVGSIIILESALSFLGLGIQPPNPSWGGMLAEGRSHMRSYPHISIVPGLAITFTVLAFNLIGDGLRDALDPHQRD